MRRKIFFNRKQNKGEWEKYETNGFAKTVRFYFTSLGFGYQYAAGYNRYLANTAGGACFKTPQYCPVGFTHAIGGTKRSTDTRAATDEKNYSPEKGEEERYVTLAI